ncbi:hypothetical protein ACFWZP_02470 [Streptomyces sp. NPDC059013]|uniref:hypothetical protein n=1 Tax=Streptomyces sp. NPDC059013 TaxID=3346697 RepID=UPI0036CD231E
MSEETTPPAGTAEPGTGERADTGTRTGGNERTAQPTRTGAREQTDERPDTGTGAAGATAAPSRRALLGWGGAGLALGAAAAGGAVAAGAPGAVRAAGAPAPGARGA